MHITSAILSIQTGTQNRYRSYWKNRIRTISNKYMMCALFSESDKFVECSVAARYCNVQVGRSNQIQFKTVIKECESRKESCASIYRYVVWQEKERLS